MSGLSRRQASRQLPVDDTSAIFKRREPCRLVEGIHPAQIELFQFWQRGNGGRQGFERISAQVELAKTGELSYSLGQGGEPVVSQVQLAQTG